MNNDDLIRQVEALRKGRSEAEQRKANSEDIVKKFNQELLQYVYQSLQKYPEMARTVNQRPVKMVLDIESKTFFGKFATKKIEITGFLINSLKPRFSSNEHLILTVQGDIHFQRTHFEEASKITKFYEMISLEYAADWLIDDTLSHLKNSDTNHPDYPYAFSLGYVRNARDVALPENYKRLLEEKKRGIDSVFIDILSNEVPGAGDNVSGYSYRGFSSTYDYSYT